MMSKYSKWLFGMSLLIASLVFLTGFEASAQIAKGAAGNIEHETYTVTATDMRSYEVIYEAINKKDYTAYSKIIREKIKEKLRRNYSYHFKDGDVDIFFILKFDGSLIDLGIDRTTSTDDKELIDIAAKSVRQASPFPRFPKTLPLSQMSFSIKVSFKES